MKKSSIEKMVTTFSQYGGELDAIPDFCSSGFIQIGIVDPKNLMFTEGYISKIKDVAEQALDSVEGMENSQYVHEFQNTPFRTPSELSNSLLSVLEASVFNHPVIN